MQAPKDKKSTGLLLMVLATLGTSGVIIICQFASWYVEQVSFGSRANNADIRWLISMVGGTALWVPLFFLSRFSDRRFSRHFYSWRLASGLAILMVPARLFKMTDAQGVASWLILALLLFLGWFRWKERGDPAGFRIVRTLKDSISNPLEWLISGVLLAPWLAWGALGSIMDLVLGLLLALLCGLALTLIFEKGILSSPPVEPKWLSKLLPLNAAPVTLVILAFGLGLNGNEWLLLLVCPPLGWLMMALARNPRSVKPLTSSGAALAVAFGLSGPLLWIDPDELSLIVTSGTGELMEWAFKAGIAAFALTVIVALLLAGLRTCRPPGARLKKGILIAALLVWLSGAIGFVLGQSSVFNGERLFIILKDQLDLTSYAAIPDPTQRRVEVYQALSRHAVQSQAGIKSILEQYGFGFQPYYLVNAIEVEAGPVVRAWLLTRPEVDRVLQSPRLRPLSQPVMVSKGDEPPPASPSWNLTMIQANLVWDELGITGKGIIVGQSDSGVDAGHRELENQFRGRDGNTDYSWFDPWFNTLKPVDTNGHGTHTLGLVLGKSVGVAPDATWIGCVNLARNLGNPALYLDCMQFMLAPFPHDGNPFTDGRPELGAQVLNNSWGCPEVEGCDPLTFLPAVKALEAAGVFVVASAGNEGETGCGSISDPIAIYEQVFSVGAISKEGKRADFSSLGPVMTDGSNRTKPDMVAPGQDVLSAFPAGTYKTLSGTSMAGPHVAGTVALMWSANPKLIGNVERTRQILKESARPYAGPVERCGSNSSPNNTAGYGIVNAYQAVKLALAEK